MILFFLVLLFVFRCNWFLKLSIFLGWVCIVDNWYVEKYNIYFVIGRFYLLLVNYIKIIIKLEGFYRCREIVKKIVFF